MPNIFRFRIERTAGSTSVDVHLGPFHKWGHKRTCIEAILQEANVGVRVVERDADGDISAVEVADLTAKEWNTGGDISGCGTLGRG